MRLFHAALSPYARKVMVCAMVRGIDRQIEIVPTNPAQSGPDLVAANPLSKVPCLVTSDGKAMFDSPVICEYLDSIGDAPPMFPPSGGARWRALLQQATADGILDAAILRRQEAGRPADEARLAVMERQRLAVSRAVDLLAAEVPHVSLDIGVIAVACALGYLDFRYAAEDWRVGRPALAAWYDVVRAAPELAATMPKDAG